MLTFPQQLLMIKCHVQLKYFVEYHRIFVTYFETVLIISIDIKKYAQAKLKINV